jgi:hypothetical protein
LQLGHLVRRLVGVVGGELVVAVEDRFLRGDALHHVLAHADFLIELRLLRQIADASALRGPGFPGKFLVDPTHDAQQRRLAGAIDAEHADFGIRVERQIDVFQDLSVARIDLGQILHVIDELAGHYSLSARRLLLPLTAPWVLSARRGQDHESVGRPGFMGAGKGEIRIRCSEASAWRQAARKARLR